MPTLNLHKILAVVNLLVASLLFIDSFLIKSIIKTEVFHMYTSTETRNDANDSHWTNFILAESGNEYREPKYDGYSLKYEDTFFVHITPLLRRPIKLVYMQSNPPTVINSGALNESRIGFLSGMFILAASILTLLNLLFFLNENWRERIIFGSTTLLLVLLFFYFF